MPLTRADFQKLADVRITEAGVLLANGMWDGAYYLAGYAVESALKACIAKLTKAEAFPDREFVAKSWTHNLESLAELAGLKDQLTAQMKADPAFATNWRLVLGWKESSRYERKPEVEAKNLYTAIGDSANGALQWIKGHW